MYYSQRRVNKLHCCHCFWYYPLHVQYSGPVTVFPACYHLFIIYTKANVMHCGASVSELYGVIVLHILFKAIPPKVLNVYTGNEIIIYRLNSVHKTQNMELKYRPFSILSDTSKLYFPNPKGDPCGRCTCSPHSPCLHGCMHG